MNRTAVRRSALLLLLLGLSVSPKPAVAEPAGWQGPAEGLLLHDVAPATLRARLDSLASVADRSDAAMALYYRGQSFERGTHPDSAIASYRRSLSLDTTTPAPDAFVDALLRRRGPGDVDEVIRLLEIRRTAEPSPDPFHLDPDPARLGWAYVLAGQAPKGIAMLEPLEARLSGDYAWRYRFARAFLESPVPKRAGPYLENLTLLGRGQDPEIADLVEQLETKLGPNGKLKSQLKAKIDHADGREALHLSQVGGRRIRIRASDGTLIGGVVYADSATRKRARAAIVLSDIGDSPADYDSLVAALRGTGHAVFVLDPRGWGWSVSPECALPDTWQGRQDALEARVALDVHDAIGALAGVTAVDTARCLVIGVGSMSPVAIAAAANDPRVGWLALLDPSIPPVERGVTIARARRASLPTYVQVSLGARRELPVAQQVVNACPLPGSALMPVTAPEPKAVAFIRHPNVTAGFLRWLGEAERMKPSRRPTPRPTPRAG